MEQKTCKRCNIAKPIDEFYKMRGMKDGRLSFCKDCTRKRVKTHRRENEHVRESDRVRSKRPDRKAHIRANTIRWRELHPDRYKAQTIVGNAVRDGKLAKQPCEICNDPRTHAHHDDYSKPLEVRWLCALHHSRTHHG